ncbi:MAG: SufE family protein [Pseudomonadota bacterium]
MATNPSFAEIEETFELLDDWEDRYRYVIDLGKDLPGLPEAQRSALTKVDGCASQVWIAPEIREEQGAAHLYFEGDSDAHIVRGLIAVLRALLSGRPASEIAASDPLAEFRKLGLDSHLSQQRSNGLRAMIERLKSLAAQAA